MSSSSSKRKKWSEEEERALISKYSDLQSNGTLSRLRTREKKFRPIADHVTSLHHLLDPISYPFSWSWKDASTKVQNMRHQYLLVKQKLISSLSSSSSSSPSDIVWDGGVSLWPNFLLYKQVFGDAPLPPKPIGPGDGDRLELGLGFDDDGDDDGFDYEDDVETETPPPPPPSTSVKVVSKKKKRRRRRDEKVRVLEEEEREWEERMDRRRGEWRKRMEEMLSQHRMQMAQIQARVLNEQQAVIGQILGIVSQWAGAADGGAVPSHGNGVVAAMQGEEGGGDGQEEDQFILDGG